MKKKKIIRINNKINNKIDIFIFDILIRNNLMTKIPIDFDASSLLVLTPLLVLYLVFPLLDYTLQYQ